MVTTTSLNADLNFTVDELSRSELPEDRQIAAESEQRLEELLQSILPVLIYVDGEIGEKKVRGVVIATRKMDNAEPQLVLARDGKWARKVGENVTEAHSEWTLYLLSDIFTGLENAFADATNKKETHLAAVTARRDLLKKVGAVIQGNKQ